VLLGILSDTHDHLPRTRRAVATLRDRGARHLVHCGDLTGPDVVYLCAASDLPCAYVLGNNEDQFVALERAIADTGGTFLGWGGEIELAGRRIAVTHGHLAPEMRRLIASRPDYLLYGHTHVRFDDEEPVGRRINPGALHRADEHTVALLDLETGTLRFLEID
jgi:putative phosphoesterase